jgi:hypothetical protein
MSLSVNVNSQPDDFSTRILRGMFDDNCRLAGRMLDIGDHGSARRMLQSAVAQVDQLEMIQAPKAKGKTTNQPKTIDV